MFVFPAVDVRGGRCVRLLKGDQDSEKVYEAAPWRAAQRWEEAGARALHVVDLDDVLGDGDNREEIGELISRVSMPVEVGGGLRSDSDVEAIIEAGAARAVLGTRAVEDPDWARSMCSEYPGRIVLALDARDGKVAVEGWQKSSGIEVCELARRLADGGPAAFLYTDVARDGTLTHPNFGGVEDMVDATDVPVIASGGVSSAEDIRRLGEAGADAVIVGKALYEQRLTLEEAMEAAAGFGGRLSPRPETEKTTGAD